MSNKALKNYLICFGVLVATGLLIFVVSKSNEPEATVEEPPAAEEREVEELWQDINGNTIVEINGEKAVYLE